MTGTQCIGCDLLRFPENTASYLNVLENSEQERRLQERRNANAERPGREFHMAQMCIETLTRFNASVSFFGAGINTDWQWLQRAYPEVQTKLVDLENMQSVPNFETIADATPSDIVVASEVIEHFEEPLAHFESLLRLVKDDGILICGTNLYKGKDISHDFYPFTPGHVTYWTPYALAYVGMQKGFFVDFRTPELYAAKGGATKRYILFFRNPETIYRLGVYFGNHMHAPSEP